MKTILLPLLSLLLLEAPMGGETRMMPSAAKRGVIVESVGKGLIADAAGLKPGDILLAWERVAGPPANTEAAKGDIASVFDWMWIEIEQGPRGMVRVDGAREGQPAQYELPAGVWELSVRPAMPDDILEKYTKGKELMAKKETAAGAALWNEVSKWGSENGDQNLTCWILNKIGTSWSKEKNWDAALAAYQSALKEAERTNIPMARAMILESLAGLHEARAEREKAEDLYRRALIVRQEAWGTSLCLARGYETLARYYDRLMDFAKPKIHLEKALDIYLQLAPESRDAARVLTNLGAAEINLGNLRKGEDYILRSLRIKEKIAPGSLGVAISLDNLGGIASRRGFLEEADNYRKQALEIEERLVPKSEDVAVTLQGLGVIAERRADYETAEYYFKRALDIYEKTSPNTMRLSYCLINLGNHFHNLSDFDKAKPFYLRSLEITKAISPQSPAEAMVLSLMGDLAYVRGDMDESEKYNKLALEIQERAAPGSWDSAYSLGNLGRIAGKREDFKTAEAYYQRALKVETSLRPNGMENADTLNDLGKMYAKMGKIPSAADAYLKAIEILEARMETLGGTAETKARFRQVYQHFYKSFLDLLIRLNKKQEAFHVLERYRAQLLLATLSERDIVWTAEIPKELDDERKAIAGEYDQVQGRLGRLNSDKDTKEIDELQAQLRDFQTKQSGVIARIKKASPKYASLRYPQPLDVAGARKILDPGTALLSYSIGEETSHVFVVTPRHFEAIPLLRSEKSLKAEIEKFNLAVQRGQTGVPLSDALITQGRELYQELIAPAEKDLARCERILVVPDGPLHSLPFSALVRPARGKSRNVQFFAEWKPIHVVQSATVFGELKKERKASKASIEKKALVAFGDPDYPRVEKNEPAMIGDAAVRSAIKRGLDLAPLPGTRAEVSSIGALFGSKGELYLGTEATEERAKSVGKGTSFIHFACHGLLDTLFPLNSGLALSIPIQAGKGRNNGILQAWEIFEQVRIDADLVALSACETGLGKELGGEGLVGLARAFQYAGARSVLATMWMVADVATSELMKRFYSNLLSGLPKDRALQFAQRDLIRKRIQFIDPSGRAVDLDASHPFYWAAFQLSGDWR